MKYILIQNDGEVELNSFELIGASTKRNEAGKIGFFGSGLKYSIAYLMRNKIGFKIFSGLNELRFSTTTETLKGQQFERICINNKPTSYTVTMGFTWTEDWFVLRELYCNAKDESNCQLIKETELVNPTEGKTRIYVALTDKLQNVIDNWDKYFSLDRDFLFKAENVYTSYLGAQDIGGKNIQSVEVFNKTDGVIFRKGIRVGERKKYIYDYQFEFVDINEDRTAKHLTAVSYTVYDLVVKLANEGYVASILRTGNDPEPCGEYSDLLYSTPNSTFNQDWIEFSHKYLVVVKEQEDKLQSEINKSKQEILYIPAQFARELKKAIPSVYILGIGRAIGDVGMSDVIRTSKMEYLLKETLTSLKEMRYEVNYPISIVQFDNNEILAQADLKEKQIYLSDIVFDKGRREIALALIEENEHIRSQHADETRAFQNYIFSEWLKTMEESNSIFL